MSSDEMLSKVIDIVLEYCGLMDSGLSWDWDEPIKRLIPILFPKGYEANPSSKQTKTGDK